MIGFGATLAHVPSGSGYYASRAIGSTSVSGRPPSALAPRSPSPPAAVGGYYASRPAVSDHANAHIGSGYYANRPSESTRTVVRVPRLTPAAPASPSSPRLRQLGAHLAHDRPTAKHPTPPSKGAFSRMTPTKPGTLKGCPRLVGPHHHYSRVSAAAPPNYLPRITSLPRYYSCHIRLRHIAIFAPSSMHRLKGCIEDRRPYVHTRRSSSPPVILPRCLQQSIIPTASRQLRRFATL
jgi:hypothetical protein